MSLTKILREKWLTADYPEKRQIFEIGCLNLTTVDATPIRKPFDVLAEGLISENSRGDKTPIELFVTALSYLQTSDPVAFAGLTGLIGLDRKQLK